MQIKGGNKRNPLPIVLIYPGGAWQTLCMWEYEGKMEWSQFKESEVSFK